MGFLLLPLGVGGAFRQGILADALRRRLDIRIRLALCLVVGDLVVAGSRRVLRYLDWGIDGFFAPIRVGNQDRYLVLAKRSIVFRRDNDGTILVDLQLTRELIDRGAVRADNLGFWAIRLGELRALWKVFTVLVFRGGDSGLLALRSGGFLVLRFELRVLLARDDEGVGCDVVFVGRGAVDEVCGVDGAWLSVIRNPECRTLTKAAVDNLALIRATLDDVSVRITPFDPAIKRGQSAIELELRLIARSRRAIRGVIVSDLEISVVSRQRSERDGGQLITDSGRAVDDRDLHVVRVTRTEGFEDSRVVELWHHPRAVATNWIALLIKDAHPDIVDTRREPIWDGTLRQLNGVLTVFVGLGVVRVGDRLWVLLQELHSSFSALFLWQGVDHFVVFGEAFRRQFGENDGCIREKEVGAQGVVRASGHVRTIGSKTGFFPDGA